MLKTVKKDLSTCFQNEESATYVYDLYDWIKEHDLRELKRDLYKLLEEVTSCERTASMMAFNAFYALSIIHREYDEIFEFKNLLEKYQSFFLNKKMLKAAQCIYLIRSQNGKTNMNYDEALKLAEECAEAIPNAPGIIHLYPAVINRALANGISISENIKIKARECIERCIELKNDWGDYYFSFAKLMWYGYGDYKKASAYILEAINREDVTRGDGLLGRTNYHVFQLEMRYSQLAVQLKEETNEAHEKISSVKEQMEKQNIKNIEILTFFVAAITLVITIIKSNFSERTFLDSCCIAIVSGGVILIISTSLCSIINSGRRKYWSLILLGSLLVAAGILMKVFLSSYAYLA